MTSVAERLDVVGRSEQYRAHFYEVDAQGPVVHFDDVSGIPFTEGIPGVEQYQHRARVRAEDGDVVVAAAPMSDGYEGYCRDVLGLGRTEFVLADGGDALVRVAEAAARGIAFERLVDIAKGAGRLLLHPYMGIEAVWDLASAVASRANVSVKVLAPPPPVTWLANDKASLDALIAEVVGANWVVENRIHRDAEGLAASLAELAGRNKTVGLKRVRCAAAMGNEVFDGKDVSTAASARRAVDRFLERTEWPAGEEVMAVVWEQTDLSPSTQIWIPKEGAPRLDGVYEQILVGEEKSFLGSRPSTLPDATNRALGDAALKVAAALQGLGYVGRCSFDHLVVGERLLFTECNGRWGGTSTPMLLVDRVVDGPRPPYRAQDYMDEALVGVPFKEILCRAREGLYDPKTKKGFLFYNVGPLQASGKFDVISIGHSQEEAEEGVLETLPSLLARG